MIKKFFILLLAIVASVGMSFAQDPGIVSSGTKGGMSYTFYDNGLLEISGSGALPGNAFTNWDGGFGTSVKNIRFAEDCEVYGLDYLWFGCYTENSQLETVEINSVAPIMFSGTSGAGIFYRQDGAVTITITAPGIVDVENRIIDNYGSPVNMIFNMPATTVFEKKWFSGLENYFAVTIPTGAKGHIPAGYVFKDSYDQEDYDRLVADGYEDMFWNTHSHLVEGVDYTLGVESTFVITAENASQIFGQATVSFQAPTEASNSEWVLWRKSDLKEFPDMSSGDQKVCKDVTVKVNNGVYNTDSGFGVHFESLAEDGVQFVAPEGKVFKRIVILNGYGTFSDPNWSYDKNYKRWSGSADTVGFVGNICGISLIEFELGDAAPATTTVTWDSNTLSSINKRSGESFTQGDVTVTVLDGIIDRTGKWKGNSVDASFKFSTSSGNFTRIEITGEIRGLGGSGWTQTSPGAVWTGDANEITFGMYFRNVTQVEFTIEESAPDPAPPYEAAMNLINEIPNPVVLTAECKAKIDAARAAYDALSDGDKNLVANYSTLQQAETDYAALNQAEADKVVAKIAAIPQPVTLKLATRDSIESARAAYDALTADQQALVTNYDVLTAAEATWAGLINVAPAGALSGKYTINDGGDVIYFAHGNLQYTRENLDADWSTGTFRLAENQYDLIELVKSSPNSYCTDNYGDKTAVGLFGWGTWGEGKTPNLTSSDRSLYTWSTDFSGTLEGTDTWRTLSKDEWVYLLAHNNQSYATVHGVNGLLVAPDGKDIDGKSMTDWVEINDETWTTMQNDGYLFLPACGQRSQLNSAANIITGGQGTEILYYSSTQYSDVYAHNIWYKPGQDPAADDYSNKRQAFGVRLVSAGVNPLDQVQVVKGLIEAIPDPVTLDDACVNAIQSARAGYDALDTDAKAILDAADVQKLNDAATQYAALEAIAAIEAIPAEIVYDPAVKAAIETAREKYDALSDASKALVDDEVVAKLTNAEEAWAILAAKVEHNVSYIGKDGELKNERVALLHIPDPAPEFNGYEFVRWDVKAGDFLEEGLRIKAVYTPIITTNPAAYDSLMYNGMAQTLITAGVAKEGHIEYRINDGEWSAELPQATFAAAYVVYYKLVREGHADYIADPINVTIAKAPVTYTAPTAVENLIYTASNQTLIAAGQTNDGTFEYSLDPTLLDSWKAELPQAMSAGTYSVYYRVQGDLNHLDSTAVDPIAVTIAKAELTATADDKNIIYGDAVPAYTVTYAGWQGDDDASVLTGDIAFACEYAQTSNVGEYTITPSGATATNYTITFVNGKVTVAKAESGCIAPVVYDTLVYNGANQTLIIAGQPMGGEMQYSLDTTVLDCWSTSLPQAKDAGTYNVYYRVKGDMNHNDHYYDLIAVSIAKAALTATAEDKTVTYGDAAPEYTVSYSGWMGTDESSVLTGTIAFACTYAPTSNVGDYTITPSGVDAANYTISFINGKVTVAKADLMITADDKSVIYGEVAPAFSASYSGWKNSDDESVVSGLTLTSEYLVTSNVGTYDIVPANASATNYAISYTNGTLTVNQAALTITANDTTMIYGDEHPEFTASYSGWKNTDDESVVSGLQFSTPYAPGSYIGTYAINPNSATALNYAITFVDGTLTVNKAHVYVSDAEAQIAKFADGHANAVVLEQGVLNGIKLNDPIAHVTTAAFSSADVAENLTITLFYELTGDAALLNNYNLDPTSDIFTTEGVIIEPFIPDNEEKPEDEEAKVNEGIEIYAYGYCDGSGYSLKYHLESGNPDQYKIDFADSRFTDVDWTNLVITGKDGTIDIEIPLDLPTGDYTMTVYFRDSRFDWLESRQFNVTFHVNLPETYVRPLFDNVIALVDTCHCLTDIQWYWRANSTELWQPIEGANGYYYHVDGKLTGEYFVYAKMNGEPTYTCGQTDMETLYGETQKALAPVVKAYPNPVVTTTTVTIENSTEWIHNIRIVNLMGAEVMNDTFEGDKTSVEMGNYPQGNYMISVDGIVVKVMKK